jgi:hypothetical protein
MPDLLACQRTVDWIEPMDRLSVDVDKAKACFRSVPDRTFAEFCVGVDGHFTPAHVTPSYWRGVPAANASHCRHAVTS